MELVRSLLEISVNSSLSIIVCFLKSSQNKGLPPDSTSNSTNKNEDNVEDDGGANLQEAA